MWPAAAVSGLIFAHHRSRYFSVDRVTKDQVESYAARCGKPVEYVEKWLAPNRQLLEKISCPAGPGGPWWGMQGVTPRCPPEAWPVERCLKE